MPELQDILRQHIGAYQEKYKLTSEQAKVVFAILNCRTLALGAHIDRCDECGFEKHSYNSCRNRHCPKCQTLSKEDWIERQQKNLLDRPYFHVVFTVPAELRPVFFQNQRLMYGLLFRAVSETLLELCSDEKYLGARPGITAILHTWGQNLSYHPHLHCVVTGGGLAEIDSWKDSRKKFFIPVKVLAKKFRGKLLSFLGKEGIRFDKNLYKKDWVVYCKPPFGGASKVVEYLGRYTHRVAISNNRILKLEDGNVTFRWRDYADDNRPKLMTLSAVEFIRRFLMHVLPSGFRKIRHFGIFASRDKGKRLALCKRLTATRFVVKHESAEQRLERIFGLDFNLCPCCGLGHLSRASPRAAN